VINCTYYFGGRLYKGTTLTARGIVKNLGSITVLEIRSDKQSEFMLLLNLKS